MEWGDGEIARFCYGIFHLGSLTGLLTGSVIGSLTGSVIGSLTGSLARYYAVSSINVCTTEKYMVEDDILFTNPLAMRQHV